MIFLQPPACDVNENKTVNIADALNDLTLNEPASQPTTDTVTVRRDSGMGSPDESETVLLSETDKTIRVTSPSGSSEDSLKHHKIRTDSGCSYGTSDDAHGVKKSKMTTSDRYDFKQITHRSKTLHTMLKLTSVKRKYLDTIFLKFEFVFNSIFKSFLFNFSISTPKNCLLKIGTNLFLCLFN